MGSTLLSTWTWAWRRSCGLKKKKKEPRHHTGWQYHYNEDGRFCKVHQYHQLCHFRRMVPTLPRQSQLVFLGVCGEVKAMNVETGTMWQNNVLHDYFNRRTPSENLNGGTTLFSEHSDKNNTQKEDVRAGGKCLKQWVTMLVRVNIKRTEKLPLFIACTVHTLEFAEALLLQKHTHTTCRLCGKSQIWTQNLS